MPIIVFAPEPPAANSTDIFPAAKASKKVCCSSRVIRFILFLFKPRSVKNESGTWLNKSINGLQTPYTSKFSILFI